MLRPQFVFQVSFTRPHIDCLQLSPHVQWRVLVLMREMPMFVGHIRLSDKDDVPIDQHRLSPPHCHDIALPFQLTVEIKARDTARRVEKKLPVVHP